MHVPARWLEGPDLLTGHAEKNGACFHCDCHYGKQILVSFLCLTTDFLKPCRNIGVPSLCQVWWSLNDMLKK